MVLSLVKGAAPKREQGGGVKKKVSSGDDDGEESGQDTVSLNSVWVVECLVIAQRAKACLRLRF